MMTHSMSKYLILGMFQDYTGYAFSQEKHSSRKVSKNNIIKLNFEEK